MADARALFLAVWTLALGLRLLLAWRLDLFHDEAFYAWQGERLALAYSDLPPVTAALAALGRGLGPEAPPFLRLPFLLLGSLLPWLVVVWARRLLPRERAWHAGSLAALLPLAFPVGAMALPEAPLVLASLLLALVLARALERPAPGRWLLLAAVAALGLNTHPRFLLPAAGAALAVLLHPAGRRALATPWPWAAGALALASLLPAALAEPETLAASLRFQLGERHPWRFAPEGLLHLPIQALVTTPVLWLGLWLGLVRLPAGGKAATRAALLGVGAFPALAYALLAPFADAQRSSLHWPFAAHLVMLPAAVAWLAVGRPWRRGLAVACLLLGGAVGFGYLFAAATPALAARLADAKAFPEGFVGGRELRAWLEARLAAGPPAALLADNVLLGAQIAFMRPEPPLFVLDHPRNAFHGRAAQLARWGANEHSFRRSGLRPAWLLLEDESVPLRERLAHYRSLCARFAAVSWREELVLYRGRRRFHLFELGGQGPSCRLPRSPTSTAIRPSRWPPGRG